MGPVAAVEPPLPSKEETERQIREEAARKQAEADHRVAQQEEDLQTLRDDDRSRFREDLRMVLQEYGKQAGKEIEELSVRAGRDDDPMKRRLAHRVLKARGTPPRTKVRQLRELGVPEPVILDYLANNYNNDLRSRNGPRTRNDVWVKAALLLLAYEPTPPGQKADDGHAAADSRAGRPASRPIAGSPPARGASRTP